MKIQLIPFKPNMNKYGITVNIENKTAEYYSWLYQQNLWYILKGMELENQIWLKHFREKIIREIEERSLKEMNKPYIPTKIKGLITISNPCLLKLFGWKEPIGGGPVTAHWKLWFNWLTRYYLRI